LVANSPGLIAGSNVLHRLLVPRHPPIALSSLSHNKKHSTNTTRCSRPLYSSQNTGRHQNKPPHTRKTLQSGEVLAPATHHTQNKASCAAAAPEKIQSDSNKPARFLRTQQRASVIHIRPTSVPHPQTGAVLTSSHRCTPNGQCSTVRSTVAQERTSWKRRVDNHTLTGRSCQCSLERR